MTITISVFLEICAGITCVCVAMGWLVKIIKIAKKPIDNLEDKFSYYDECLKRDKKDINRLNSIADSNTECLELLLSSTLAILGHLELGNHTNEMKNERQKIQTYLTSKVSN